MAIASGTCGTCSWTIADNGAMTIGAGTLHAPWLTGIMNCGWPWGDHVKDIKSCTIATGVIVGKQEALMGGYTDYYVTSNMFYGCSEMTSLTFQGTFNTVNVTDMSGMFFGCSSLTSLDLSPMNTSKVKDMGIMFSGCTLLTSVTFGPLFSTSALTDSQGLGFVGYDFPTVKNQTGSLIVTSDTDFRALSPAQHAGTWTRSAAGVAFKVSADGRQGFQGGVGVSFGIELPLYQYKKGAIDLDLGASIGAMYNNFNLFTLNGANSAYVNNGKGWAVIPMLSELRATFAWRTRSVRDRYLKDDPEIPRFRDALNSIRGDFASVDKKTFDESRTQKEARELAKSDSLYRTAFINWVNENVEDQKGRVQYYNVTPEHEEQLKKEIDKLGQKSIADFEKVIKAKADEADKAARDKAREEAKAAAEKEKAEKAAEKEAEKAAKQAEKEAAEKAKAEAKEAEKAAKEAEKAAKAQAKEQAQEQTEATNE